MQIPLCLIFFLGVVFSESNVLRVEIQPKEVFLAPNTNIICEVNLLESPFKGKIEWYRDGSSVTVDPMFGPIAWPSKVTYPLTVEHGGTYTCLVTDNGQQWNATARVVIFKGISDMLLGDVTDDEIKLTCPEGPPGTSAFIMVNENDRLEKMAEDSFTLKKPELIDAERLYTCQYVFTNDIAEYGDIQSIPKDRVIFARLPFYLYKLLKKEMPPESANYSVTIQPSIGDLRVEICGANNNSVISVCDNGSLVIDSSDVNVTFSVYMGTKVLLAGSFTGVHNHRDTDRHVDRETENGVPVWVVVIGVAVVVAGTILTVILFKKKKGLCFKDGGPDANPANSTQSPLMELKDQDQGAKGEGDHKDELRDPKEGVKQDEEEKLVSNGPGAGDDNKTGQSS